MVPRGPDAPEQRTRQKIDATLGSSGWVVQDRDEMNVSAGRGVAVRERCFGVSRSNAVCGRSANDSEPTMISRDTDAEAHAQQIAAYRRMPGERRLQIALAMSDEVRPTTERPANSTTPAVGT